MHFIAEFRYKQKFGYFPGVLMSGEMILGIVMCEGNNNVKFQQEELLRHFFSLLKAKGIMIHSFRADSGSYKKEVVDVLREDCEYFYLRANNCQKRLDMFDNDHSWKTCRINGVKCEVNSFPFDDFGEDKCLRLVVQRVEKHVERKDDGQLMLFEDEKDYEYRPILTNDWLPCESTIISHYNARGAEEKLFDVQNNDFGWSHMPFSQMNENVVFLLATATLKNFYLYILQSIKAKLPAGTSINGMRYNCRLKSFMSKFVCVVSRWVYRGRQWILNLYTDQPYEYVFSS